LPSGEAHRGTVFLKAAVQNPRFEVGDFTYASDFDPPEDWGAHLAPYLFEFSPETLRIGKFCQIAHGVRFITASANHAMGGLGSRPIHPAPLAPNPQISGVRDAPGIVVLFSSGSRR
jgi:virginiamycin A acetyltransferase